MASFISVRMLESLGRVGNIFHLHPRKDPFTVTTPDQRTTISGEWSPLPLTRVLRSLSFITLIYVVRLITRLRSGYARPISLWGSYQTLTRINVLCIPLKKLPPFSLFPLIYAAVLDIRVSRVLALALAISTRITAFAAGLKDLKTCLCDPQ